MSESAASDTSGILKVSEHLPPRSLVIYKGGGGSYDQLTEFCTL